MTNVQVRKLNDEGIQLFMNWINEPTKKAPKEILFNNEYSEQLDTFIGVSTRKRFSSRFEAGKYLSERIGSDMEQFKNDNGFWAWISLLYITQLTEKNEDGFFVTKNIDHYILNNGGAGVSKKYHFHFLRAPSVMYSLYGKYAHTLFGKSNVNQHGMVTNILVNRQDIAGNENMVKAFYYMMMNPKTGEPKSSLSTMAKAFAATAMQFDKNFDVPSLTLDNVLYLLKNTGAFNKQLKNAEKVMEMEQKSFINDEYEMKMAA